jgi:hypothetical protein
MTTIRLLPPADLPRNGRKVLDVPDALVRVRAATRQKTTS